LGKIPGGPLFDSAEKTGEESRPAATRKTVRLIAISSRQIFRLCIIGRRFRPNDTRPIGLGTSRQKRLENTERVRKIAVLQKKSAQP